jgi:mannose-6-phosphate isomerase-like protein (cupin superfamily)
MKKKHTNVIFPKIKNVGKRNWGEEKLLALIPKILSLKLLKLKKGKKGGLQYHHKKNECGYIIKGKLLIRFDNGNGKLSKKIIKKGDSFHFPPGSVHQEEAITDCNILEASSPHFNDRVRVERKYNIKEEEGLPSTKKRDVILK